jgi:hypothetical protein
VLRVGCEFDTKYERGCRVVTMVDDNGNFTATDSDGAVCLYSTSMVESAWLA